MVKSYDTRGNVVRRYVDILTNVGFKALFGDVNNKEAVMTIMNALLPEHRRVAHIEYMQTEYQGQMADNKEYHYDFMCRDAHGAMFIVEMQSYDEEYWFKRCVSYASRVYDRQNKRGADYDVPPVYLIGLMSTEISHSDPVLWTDHFVSEYTFREKSTGELLDETIIIIFVELARFCKGVDECSTDVDKMMYLLKNMGNLKHRPAWLQREVYTKIFDACEIGRFTEEKLIKYEKDMYDERRLNGELAAAERKGREEGLKATARKMHEMSMPVDVIAEVTGLSLEAVNAMICKVDV